MTTNQLTYQGLVEQERANRANEALRKQQIEAEVAERSAGTDYTRAKIDELNQKLPAELRLTAAQIDQAVSNAAKNYQGIGRVTESSALAGTRHNENNPDDANWMNLALDNFIQAIKTVVGAGTDIMKLDL